MVAYLSKRQLKKPGGKQFAAELQPSQPRPAPTSLGGPILAGRSPISLEKLSAKSASSSNSQLLKKQLANTLSKTYSPACFLSLRLDQKVNGGHLQVSKRNLYCWRMAGLVPYFKIGRAVRFRTSDLDAALERMRMG